MRDDRLLTPDQNTLAHSEFETALLEHRSLLTTIAALRGQGKTLPPATEWTVADEAAPSAENDLMDLDHVPKSLARSVQRFVAGPRS